MSRNLKDFKKLIEGTGELIRTSFFIEKSILKKFKQAAAKKEKTMKEVLVSAIHDFIQEE
jgi:hypothetical protein